MSDISNITENRICPILYLVVPCYNEEDIIKLTASAMSEKLNSLFTNSVISPLSKIMFVNDGSKDSTLKILHELAKDNSIFSVISLVGNSGHQNAILAGMMVAKKHADIVVTIDADLQQDINALDKFIESYKSGSEVVYGVRNDRNSDGILKKSSATLYYKLMHLLGSNVITNHADYRLMSKKALEALSSYDESNLFLRGLIPSMGFESDIVYFDVKEREAGQSKYTLHKMLSLAAAGITSFSIKPLHMITALGGVVILFSIGMIILSLIDWFMERNVPGYTTLVMLMLILFGMTLLSLGVIGEYIGHIYLETKNRPHYIIDSIILKEAKNDKPEQ